MIIYASDRVKIGIMIAEVNKQKYDIQYCSNNTELIAEIDKILTQLITLYNYKNSQEEILDRKD